MPEPSDRVRCYFPGRRFPAFSVTGRGCALGCAHCEGKLLSGMRPVTSPDSLLAAAERLASIGGTGFLLSGGCDEEGRVPLAGFVEAVAVARGRWGLKVNLHPGLLGPKEAADLIRSGADCYSVDLHRSARVIREVLHLKAAPSAYRQTLEALESAGAESIVPHITVGLDTDGEDAFRSVELASEFDIAGLVVLVFTPLKGTTMGAMSPPANDLVLRVLEQAQSRIDRPVSLGCMRPRGNSTLEISAIKSGIRDIAMPSKEAVEWAESHELTVERLERCCAVHL
ncbi:MAG: radical SAM protein [Methanomassiliicoccales archaeon]|nr:radical SAM protein [Methanomassiliicoccales archaeon]